MRYVACKDYDNNVALNGDVCVTTIQDLYSCLVFPQTSELLIRADFASEYFTPSGLTDFLTNAKTVNPRLAITTDSDMTLDVTTQVKNLKTVRGLDELMYVLIQEPDDTMNLINVLCDYYLGTYSETLVANNKISTQHLQISNLQKNVADLTKDKQTLLSKTNELEEKLHILLSRINYKYGHNMNLGGILDITGHKFDKILYIKEITRVHFTDTLIYYLQEILRTLYSVPCRFVVMEPFYAYDHSSMYPRCKPSFDLTYDDVRQADIFMAGFHPELVNDILKNSSGVNYIIILDRAGGNRPHIHGDNIETLYCASDLSDLVAKEYTDRTITYNKAGLNIPYIAGFDELAADEKIKKYSSMPIVKTIINLMERR